MSPATGHLLTALAALGRMAAANEIGMVTSTPDGVRDANDAFLRLTGNTRADLEAGRVHWKVLTAPEWTSMDGEGLIQVAEILAGLAAQTLERAQLYEAEHAAAHQDCGLETPDFRPGRKRRSPSACRAYRKRCDRRSLVGVRTAYKCRAYPAPEQASVLNRTFGCVRVVWNRTLAWRHARYDGEQVKTNFTQANAYLTAMKATEELAWLNEVSSVPLQQAIRHQQVAYTSFYAKRTRYPRFKSRTGRQSAEYTRSGFRYRGGALFLAKMGTPLAFTWSWPGIDPAAINPTTVTVSRDPCGRWYVSLAVDVPEPEQFPATGAVAGVDLGIKDFAVTSGGQKMANPRTLARRERALARYQRRLARCQRGSANRAKARAKVARAHRKVRASRTDFLHRTSTALVRDHDVIVIEDLAVHNMVRNRSLAKAIADCGWGTFRQMIAYKAARAGRHLIVIDRWYPSSKTCSACGHLLADLSLNTRHWTCPSCRTRHDRDINAAKNILAAGLAVGAGTGADACGADVRHPGSSRVQSAMKQEPPGVSPGIPVLQSGE